MLLEYLECNRIAKYEKAFEKDQSLEKELLLPLEYLTINLETKEVTNPNEGVIMKLVKIDISNLSSQ